MIEESPERWVTMKDVQEHLGVRRETVTSWIHKRDLPAYKMGRQWKFKLSEVDEWVRSGEAADHEPKTEKHVDEANGGAQCQN